MDKTLQSNVRFRIDEMHEQRVIYAYTVDGEAKYIGICEKVRTTLKERMMRYQGRVGGTNRRITDLIKDCLTEGKKVKILALGPTEEMEFRGLKIDLVKGLENPLLQEVMPEWNVRW